MVTEQKWISVTTSALQTGECEVGPTESPWIVEIECIDFKFARRIFLRVIFEINLQGDDQDGYVR